MCKYSSISKRFALTLMALFPALWGIFSLLNNISGFSGTVQYAVYPMIKMADTYGNPAQTWRAIDSMFIAQIGLVLITAIEAIAGFLGTFAVIMMLKNIKKPYANFIKGQTMMTFACTFAVLVWGIGFIVIAGDWFLAWQAKQNGLNTQLGGLIYALPCMLGLMLSVFYKEEL